MGLVERLNELGLMRQNGQISDSEYALLVESATRNFGKENEVVNTVGSESDLGGNSDVTQPKSISRMSKLGGLAAVAVLIIFLLVISRGGSSSENPTEPVSDETSQSSSAWDATREKQENSAKACRDKIGLTENQDILTIIRTGFDTDSDVSGVVNYEKAGSLNGAKSWIESEMRWVKSSLEIVEQIGRPELSIETTAMVRVLNDLVDLQINLLDAGSFTEFNQITPKYHIVLNRFFNLGTLDSALSQICTP